MELKLVYRALCKVSEWILSGFYSEVLVEGQENVSKTAPTILASTHHNEIIDTATLSTTIPHGRRVCFWAKSSLFRNPLAAAILSSSGAIPVFDNPNKTVSNGASAGSSSNSTTKTNTRSLFAESTAALRKGDVIGVFAEGASYTEPRIMQLLSGAVWAAIDCVRDNLQLSESELREKGSNVQIVPVAIVYTDKSQFQSKVYVRYGKPIDVGAYRDRLSVHEDAQEVAKILMSELDQKIHSSTINAKDWPTFYAACAARDILYPKPDTLPLRSWVPVSQRIVQTISSEDHSAVKTREALSRYCALLLRTGIQHQALEALYHTKASLTPSSKPPSMLRILLPSFSGILSTALFIPSMITHIPGYIFGQLVVRFLSIPGEEEGIAQYRSVGSGVGLALYWMFLIPALWRLPLTKSLSHLPYSISTHLSLDFIRQISNLNWYSRMLLYAATARVFIAWHSLFIESMHRRWKRLIARYVLLSSRFLKPVQGPLAELCEALPPPPKQNVRTRKNAGLETESRKEYPVVKVAGGRMVPLLLERRREATRALYELLRDPERRDTKTWLLERNATLN